MCTRKITEQPMAVILDTLESEKKRLNQRNYLKVKTFSAEKRDFLE